ncbi:MAG: tail fiber domain-containing protein [Chitinophagaceae bacterium]
MKRLLFILFVMQGSIRLQAQNVGIGTSSPSASAMLEISSSSKGLLLPRVADTSAVSSPAKGLVIYNNANNKLWYYDGSRWQQAVASGGGMDSIWYQLKDSIAYTTKKYVSINTDPDLIEPQTNLQVTGGLLLQNKLKYSNTTPTPAQTYTMNNTGLTQTIPASDSVFRIYDPGGAGNYSNSMQGNMAINPGAAKGYKISSSAADFGLSLGDTLWISENSYPDCRIDYDYIFTNTTQNPADFICGFNTRYFIFRSNADGNNGKGFNLKVTRLFYSGPANEIQTAGQALYFNATNGAFAAGLNAVAKGEGSVALGSYTKASGYHSTVMGESTKATGSYATAMGDGTTASGSAATAMGFSSRATGQFSTAMGYNTEATASSSTSIGNGTVASGDYSTATGYATEASGRYAATFGKFTKSIGYGALATGDSTKAIGLLSFAGGFRSNADGDYATAIGKLTQATGYASTASGDSTVAGGKLSFASGYQCVSSGDYSTAMGEAAIASGPFSTAIGNSPDATGGSAVALGAFTLASGRNSTALGVGTQATADYSTALGAFSEASGDFSVAIGNTNTASGHTAVALGSFTTAAGNYSSSMGSNTISKGYAGTALGMYNSPVLLAAQLTPTSTTPLFIVGNGDFGNLSNAMTVFKSGNVGIGTSAIPVTRLQIVGGSDASLSSNSGYLVLGDVNSNNMVIDNNEIIARNNGANTTLFLQNNGGALEVGGTASKPGGGSWAVASDARLKEHVSPYIDGLQQLLKINPVYYNYNQQSGYDTQKQYIGVLAQELKEIAPYMVGSFIKDNNGYLNVDNSAMTYMLINAVKEQQKQIEELKALVNILINKSEK